MATQMAPADLNGSQQDTERLESERGTCGRKGCKGWEESVIIEMETRVYNICIKLSENKLNKR